MYDWMTGRTECGVNPCSRLSVVCALQRGVTDGTKSYITIIAWIRN